MVHLPAVLIVGTYHMGNRHLDLVKPDADDVRTDERQRQMWQLAARLERFRPTRVAVEVAYDRDEELNAEYQRYRRREVVLGRDEVHQLGFRIADELGHESIYPIDWWDWRGTEIGLDTVMSAARAFGQGALADDLFGDPQRQGAESTRSVASRDLLTVFREGNQPEALRQNHAVHLSLARIGEGREFTGADWLTQWYERNLKIFANLLRIAEPQDRILVLIGSAHVLPLQEFVVDSGLLDLEPADQYLR